MEVDTKRSLLYGGKSSNDPQRLSICSAAGQYRLFCLRQKYINLRQRDINIKNPKKKCYFFVFFFFIYCPGLWCKWTVCYEIQLYFQLGRSELNLTYSIYYMDLIWHLFIYLLIQWKIIFYYVYRFSIIRSNVSSHFWVFLSRQPLIYIHIK